MTPTGPTVVRVYHAGGESGHQARDAALAAAGARVVLVIPRNWPGAQPVEAAHGGSGVEVIEVDVSRAGDVNRHRHLEIGRLAALLRRVRPDILDVHEEPVSVATRQLLALAPAGLPVVGFTAQNLDKRFPPPYAQYERSALARISGLYPCTRQAASVAWGKGFRGHVRVLPLGYEPDLFKPGAQRSSLATPVIVLAGRLVAEKGVRDAVAVLAAVRRRLPARLVLVGSGPEVESARADALAAGVADAVTYRPWLGPTELAALYRQAHIMLAPSRSTSRWVEQFGRMVTEAQASGAVVCGYSTGALPEVGGDLAVLVPEGDAESLAGKVVTLLTEPSAWLECRELALDTARGRAWEAVAQEQIAFYEQVLRAPRPCRSAAPDGRSRREAHARYGPPARAGEVARPFAVPLVRELGSTAQSAVGRLIDVATAGTRRVAQRGAKLLRSVAE